MATSELWSGHGLHRSELANEKCAAALPQGRSGDADADAVGDAHGRGVFCALPELAPACDTFPRHFLAKPEAW